MELVEVTLTPLQRRAGAVWLPWRDLAAQQLRRGEPVRALTPGDDVMLRIGGGSDEERESTTAGGDVRRGWVLRNATAAGESAYVIVFGDAVRRRVPLADQRPTGPRRGTPAQRRPEPRPEARPESRPEPRVQEVQVRVVPRQREPFEPPRSTLNLYL
jgi:hypothetical protein